MFLLSADVIFLISETVGVVNLTVDIVSIEVCAWEIMWFVKLKLVHCTYR